MAIIYSTQGNLILTDANYKIVTLIRTYKNEETGANIAVNETYPIEKFQNLPEITDGIVGKIVADYGKDHKGTLKDLLSKHIGLLTRCNQSNMKYWVLNWLNIACWKLEWIPNKNRTLPVRTIKQTHSNWQSKTQLPSKRHWEWV